MMRVLSGLSLYFALSGCAAICGLDVRGSVEIIADPSANDRSAIAVDVVAVRGEALAERLATLSASHYFLAREQIERDASGRIGVSGWEIAPGQTVGPQSVSFECGVDAVFVFASYRTPGVHRMRLTDLDDVRIVLGPEGFEVNQ